MEKQLILFLFFSYSILYGFNLRDYSPQAVHSFAIQPKLGRFVPLSGNIDQLKPFFDALSKSTNRVVKIGHYGDSLIQGDIISEYLRERLQERFSGRGVGFLSIVSNDIKMRKTTRHSFSDDWNYVSIITRNPDKLPFGISGAVAIPKPNSWVKYETTNFLKSCSSFQYAKIYYSHADNSSTIQYTINGKTTTTAKLKSGESVQEFLIDTKGNSSSIEIKFVSGKEPFFYGVSLESGNGVYLDNFPMPGNTGASLLEIPTKRLEEFNKLVDYNLIILCYGANVSSPNKGIFTVYENKILTVINQFKKVFPNAGFLLIGVGDKTLKKGGRFITNPDVSLLLETQKRIVEKGQIAFWNLWEAMGGLNSMEEWVSSNPPMALKDYSHFTPEGGKRVAELLFEAILDAYNKTK